MVKQPLFGQDSSPHKTSAFISGLITFVLWILFVVSSIFVQFKPKVPQYKEVQIVLSSTPIEEAESYEQSTDFEQTSTSEAFEAPAVEESVVEEQSAPVEQKPAVVEQQPAVVEPVETTKPKETPKPAPAKTTTTQTTDTSKKVNFDDFQYATDYSDFSFDNSSASSSKSSFDWSQFEDSSSEPEPAVSQKVDKVTTASSTSGSAASTSNANQRQTSSSASSSSSADSTPSALSSTSAAAAAIKNTTGASSSTGTASSTGDTQKFNSDLDITWNGGTARKAKGALSISLTTGSSIKEKKITVKIEFVVGEDGYVTPGSIKITPESLLPENVRKEVISQINLWRFNEAQNRSTAAFEYTIIKKD